MALAWSIIECRKCGAAAEDDVRRTLVDRLSRGWADPPCPACGGSRWTFHPYDCQCDKHPWSTTSGA
jgi:hypothetical protein